MKAQALDWSDIPFVLAVCEAGSLSAAARALNVNHSTVFRRIEGVESRLGVRLFDRLNHGYVMTPAGEHFYRHALHLRDGLNGIQRELSGKDLRLEGSLTVTTTDSLLYFLTPLFADFQNRYPEIELRLISDSRALDLMQRDADVAIRPTTSPPEHWIGRQVAPIVCATYCHREYWTSVRRLPKQNRRWVRLDRDLSQSPMSAITKSRMPAEAPCTVVNTVMGVFDYVRAGQGVAVVPCYLGERASELVRIDEPDTQTRWDLWVLSHPDVRRSARVHAFFDFASAEITKVFADLIAA
ncbi:MAG: LysR family transcriptional regulator [Pseudomonadota bacterium]